MAVFVVFVHPDGRELPAVVTALHSDGSADLVAIEGSTAPFGGTAVYEGVPASDTAPGQESARHSWHRTTGTDAASTGGGGEDGGE